MGIQRCWAVSTLTAQLTKAFALQVARLVGTILIVQMFALKIEVGRRRRKSGGDARSWAADSEPPSEASRQRCRSWQTERLGGSGCAAAMGCSQALRNASAGHNVAPVPPS